MISFAEFQAFEGLLCTPDALYKTAFQLFDTNGNGNVNYNEFCEIIKKTELHAKIPFHLDGNYVQRYFGKVSKMLWNHSQFVLSDEVSTQINISTNFSGVPFISPFESKSHPRKRIDEWNQFYHVLSIFYLNFERRRKNEQLIMRNSRNCCMISMKSMPKKHLRAKIQVEPDIFRRLISPILWSVWKNTCSRMMLKII